MTTPEVFAIIKRVCEEAGGRCRFIDILNRLENNYSAVCDWRKLLVLINNSCENTSVSRPVEASPLLIEKFINREAEEKTRRSVESEIHIILGQYKVAKRLGNTGKVAKKLVVIYESLIGRENFGVPKDTMLRILDKHVPLDTIRWEDALSALNQDYMLGACGENTFFLHEQDCDLYVMRELDVLFSHMRLSEEVNEVVGAAKKI